MVKNILKKDSTTEKKLEGTQLNKFLSNAGVASRRECAEFVKNGAVKVNGKVIKEPGYRVMKTDVVVHKGKKVSAGKKVYILLNKPKDYITTLSDERDRKTVMELVKDATTERIYPVGRLDRNTTGLLFFTNDGDLAQQLSHPSKGVKKLYEVSLNRELHIDDMQQIAKGIELEDGLATVDEIFYAHQKDNRVIGIKLHIGKNRVVRRIFEKLGYDVVKLDWVGYAAFTKRDLPRGKWRHLTEREVKSLKYFS